MSCRRCGLSYEPGPASMILHEAMCGLRPTRMVRVSAMRIALRVLVILAIVSAAALAIWTSRVDARSTVRPVTEADCQRLWDEARPGDRWPLKQACLRQIEIAKCRKLPRPVPRGVRVKGVRSDAGQRKVIGWLVSEGLRRHLTRTQVLAALVAATQESSARELRHGHGTSLGPLQLIDTHGTAAQRITIEFSGNWFYNGTKKVRLRGMSAPALAQRVQRSAYPSAYAQWLPESRRTLRAVLGPCPLR